MRANDPGAIEHLIAGWRSRLPAAIPSGNSQREARADLTSLADRENVESRSNALGADRRLTVDRRKPQVNFQTAIVTVPDRKRFRIIDHFRIVAAAMVLLHHLALVGYATKQTSYTFAPLAPIATYGYLGVPLFFVISGFVIAMSAEAQSPAQFAIARFVRLFPAFWISCTLTFGASRLFGAAAHTVPLRVYLVNLSMLQSVVGFSHVDEGYWTLFEELKFYSLVWIILRLRQFHNYEIVLRFLCVLSAVVYLRSQQFSEESLLLPQMGQIPYFIAGSTYYLAYKKGWNVNRVLLACAAVALSCLWSGRSAHAITIYCQIAIHPAVVCLVLLAINAAFLPITARWDVKRGATYAAALTYPLYLLHARIGYILLDRIMPGDNSITKLLFVSASVLLLAVIVHHLELWCAPHLKRNLHRFVRR